MTTNLVHRAEVLRIEELSAGMVRVVLGGEGLEGFESTGVGDEYLRMWLPHEDSSELVLPKPAGADAWSFDDDVVPSPLRTYTVRAWNERAGELTIDMVRHGHGLAGRWAARAASGDVVGVNTPRGMYAAPDDLEWILMASDAAGLPAAARILEGLPPHVRARIFLEVPNSAHEHSIPVPPGAEVHWLHGGNGHGPSRLEEIVRGSTFPQGVGYVWVAGETHVTRAVRKYLRHELGLPPSDYKVVGYWTEHAEEWEARYRSLPDDVLTRLAALWDDPERDEEEIEDEYDETLARFDL